MASETEDADASFPLQNPRRLRGHLQRAESGSSAEIGRLPPSHQPRGFQHFSLCGTLHIGHHLW